MERLCWLLQLAPLLDRMRLLSDRPLSGCPSSILRAQVVEV